MSHTVDTRSIVSHPKLFLEDVGYNIDKDCDRPGLWVWTGPTDGCESSFNTAEGALENAWTDACAHTMAVYNLSSDEWDSLSFEQQKQSIIEALSDDGSVTAEDFNQSPEQMDWVERVRKVYPHIGSKEAFRLAQDDYISNNGILPA